LTTTLPLSILERMLSDAKLEEITYESEMEKKDEKEGESRKDEVPPVKPVEEPKKKNNTRKGKPVRGVRKENKGDSSSS